MNAMLLTRTAPAEQSPLQPAELPTPSPRPDEILVRVLACGVCHTDLHTVEGELPAHLPIVPGHQIVGIVEQAGDQVTEFRAGDRVGIPWVHRTCRACDYCRAGRENLCDAARFTGLHVNGGYAARAIAVADFAVKIPAAYSDREAAPLLCAGIVGFRALRVSGVRPFQRLGLYGFGASAHLAVQVATGWNCEVLVATRSEQHQHLARELGAGWVGQAGDMPSAALDAAVMFAPAGGLVPEALRALRKGGTLALAGIHMSPIPQLRYELLYHERVIRSVANATRDDARAFMQIAGERKLRAEVEPFPLQRANEALLAIKHSRLRAAAVLTL
jgi:propanol-preferring alcohol dehydrogenase